jgi:type IV fimbrial biogenesis protein FimT
MNTQTKTEIKVLHEQNARGFTIIELMITIAIAAIVLMLAVPSFTRAIDQAKFTSASNELITAMNFARNEAMRRSRPVSVRMNAGGWIDGWTAFIDPDRNGVIGPPADLLRAGNKIPAAVEITGGAGGLEANVLFDSRGRRLTIPGAAFVEFLVHKTGAPADQRRWVCIAGNGRISTVKGASSCAGA